MLVVGFTIYFWVTPKVGISANDLASARLARMEASVSGRGSSKSGKQETPKYKKLFENTQKKQMEYFTILVMVIGGASLGYSFIKKKKPDA